MNKNKLIPIKRTAIVFAAAFALHGCNSDSANPNAASEPSLAIGAATSADFVAVRVEAENYNDLTGGWTLTSQDSVPAITPDPDPPHFSTASNGTYVELLPDTRVTHDDVLIPGENYWGNPGNGPRLEYDVNIPEPGRYYVYVKAYSTGAEDNGIHVGIDGHKPASGYRIQLCTGKNRWTWSSAQRVDTNHCGVRKTIYIDVDSAGSHNIIFYAREDGFELDQFLLIKDVNEGITDCFPLVSDKIRCIDVESGDTIGNYVLSASSTNEGNEVIVEPPVSPAIVDLQLSLTTSNNTAVISEEIEFTLKVDNVDDNDTATSVETLVTLPAGLDFVSSDICTEASNQLTCIFSELAPDEQTTASFTAAPNASGTLRVDAQVSAEQQETTMGNNTASVHIVASERIPDYEGSLTVIQGPNALGLTDQTTHLVSVNNNGQQQIAGATLEISANTAVTVSSTDPGCSGTPVVTCAVNTIQPGDNTSIPVTLSGNNTGHDNVTIQLTVVGDEDTSNNTLNTAVYVIENNTVTDTNGVITLEAESFNAQTTPNASPLEGAYNSAWFVVSDTLTPSVSPDYDSISAATTSNGSYIEFLPDTRVGDADPVLVDISNYQNGGSSAALTYSTFFNTAGRYYTAALIRANNNQDGSVHIGFNDQWPDSSAGVSVCTPDGKWQWTNNTDCGSGTAGYIDIPTPGIHYIQLSAATDGTEIDKIALSLDSTELPTATGNTQQIYTPQDIDLAISSSLSSGVYSVTVQNLDPALTAASVVVELTGLEATKAGSVTGFDGCTHSNETIECNIDYIGADSQRTATVNIDTETDISASLVSANDSVSSNNKTATTVTTGGGLIDLLFLLMLSTLITIRWFTPNLLCKKAH